MTSKAALCKALLDGKVLNIKNGFNLFGITNIPREIGRAVERPFGVIVSRTQMEGKSRYGQPVTWYDYRLNATEYNEAGMQKMQKYVSDNAGNTPAPEKKKKVASVVTNNDLFNLKPIQ